MICANFTIAVEGDIIPFGANGRTKLDFENLDGEEVIAKQCVSVSQLPIAVVANAGMGFYANPSATSNANLAYADKVSFLFTEDEVVASILGEVSYGGFLINSESPSVSASPSSSSQPY